MSTQQLRSYDDQDYKSFCDNLGFNFGSVVRDLKADKPNLKGRFGFQAEVIIEAAFNCWSQSGAYIEKQWMEIKHIDPFCGNVVHIESGVCPHKASYMNAMNNYTPKSEEAVNQLHKRFSYLDETKFRNQFDAMLDLISVYASICTTRENCDRFVKGWVQYREHIMELFRFKMTSSKLLYQDSKTCRYSDYRPAFSNISAPMTGPGLLQGVTSSGSNHGEQATALSTKDQAKATLGKHISKIIVEDPVPANRNPSFSGAQNNSMPHKHNEHQHYATHGHNFNPIPTQHSSSHQSNSTWYVGEVSTPKPIVPERIPEDINPVSHRGSSQHVPTWVTVTNQPKPTPTGKENSEPKRPPRAQTAVAGSRHGQDATEQMRKEKEILEQKMGEMVGKIEELVQVNKKLQQEKTGLLDQLSRGMNRQLGLDESDLENINVRARPMKIMEEYELFCSQQWLEAKTLLDEKYENSTERQRCEILCGIIDESYKEALRQYDFFKHGVLQLLENPLKTQSASARIGEMKTEPKGLSLDADLEVALSKNLKEKSKDVDFSELAKDVLKRQTQFSHSTSMPESMINYTAMSLSLAWKMILQRPAMTFDHTSLLNKKFDESKAELHFGSMDPSTPGAVVEYCVHPALYHGDKQMRKARVIVGRR